MKQPNILIILTDQQRKDSLGCYGGIGVKTPHIDRLAARGTRFDRCYAANPICTPNRMSLFTGLMPSAHGRFTNGLPYNDSIPTLVNAVADYGYQTASFGKIHFEPYGASPDQSQESLQKWQATGDDVQWNGPYYGFQHVELTIGHTAPVAHYGKWFHQRGGADDMLATPSNGPKSDTHSRPLSPALHDTTFVAERTCWYLREGRDKTQPFFAVASFPDPHHPFNPPDEIAQCFDPGDMPDPISGDDIQYRPIRYQQHAKSQWHRNGETQPEQPRCTPEQTRQRRAYTAAMVHWIDQGVGQIMDALDEEQLLDDTIIVYTTDHGELLGDHDLWYKGPFFYEQLINLPLIIAGPDIPSGTSTQLISTIDILPTVMAAAQIPVPSWVRGVDIHSVDEDCKVVEYRSGFNENDVAHAVLITKQYKYVHSCDGGRELTDLVNDPDEQINLAGSPAYQELESQLRDQLLTRMLNSASPFPLQVCHA